MPADVRRLHDDACLGFPASVSFDVANEVAGAFSPEEVAALVVALMTFNFTSRTAVALGGMPDDPLPVVEIAPAMLAP